jgi:hypothetical protein
MEKSASTRGWFSKKVDGRGIKVQFIVDATERVRYVHGPVEPGQYDGSFLELRRDEIIEKFPGEKFIGDNHYSSGMELFKDPVFYCNERESAKDRKVAEKEGLETHSRAPKKKEKKGGNRSGDRSCRRSRTFSEEIENKRCH